MSLKSKTLFNGTSRTYPYRRANKKQATETLATQGLSVADAVRIMLAKIATENTLPFNVREPNAETAAALEACRRGDVVNFNSVEDLMADLNADD